MADRCHAPPWVVLEADGFWYLKTLEVVRAELAGRRDREKREARLRRRGARPR